MSTATASPATTVQAVEAAHVLQTYKRQPVVFVRGEGVWLVADDGKRYLDMLSGIGVNVLGHAHPGAGGAPCASRWANWSTRPTSSSTRIRASWPNGSPRPRASSGRSSATAGAEAVEGCLKFARRFWYTAGTPRTQFIAFERGFSGRTMGALSTTWDEHYRVPFGPLVPEVRFVSNEDPADLLSAVSDNTAAIIAEPIQGEGGVRPLPPQIVAAINRPAARRGALHRRRSAVGPRAHRPPVRVRGARAVPGPDLGGQGARRWRPDRRGAGVVARGGQHQRGRPRHDVRRQSAGLPCGARRDGHARARGLLDHVRRVGPVLRRRPARARREAPDGRRGPRRGPDAGPRARPRRQRPWCRPRSSAA